MLKVQGSRFSRKYSNIEIKLVEKLNFSKQRETLVSPRKHSHLVKEKPLYHPLEVLTEPSLLVGVNIIGQRKFITSLIRVILYKSKL